MADDRTPFRRYRDNVSDNYEALHRAGQPEQARAPKFNHVPHVILAVLTGGLWLIPWFLIWRFSPSGKQQARNNRKHNRAFTNQLDQVRKERGRHHD